MSTESQKPSIGARIAELIGEHFGPMVVREKLVADGFRAFEINDALAAVDPARWREAARARLLATYGDPEGYDIAKKSHTFRDLRRRGFQERLIRELVYPEMLGLDAPFEVITKPNL